MKANILFCLILALMFLAVGCEKKQADTQSENEQASTSEELRRAARDGDIEQVRSLISSGADLSRKTWPDWTPLHDAAVMGHKDVVELLIAEGAEIDAKDDWHRTPLLLAANSLEGGGVAELLVAKGADVNAMNNNGFTPLLCALQRRNENLAELLITRGADVNVGAGIRPPSPPAPKPGPVVIIHTPLHYAAR